MDRLWTPWRYQYISNTSEANGCIFCEAAESADDHGSLVIHRAERNFVILNRFPYTNGHLMIAPYQHGASLTELPDGTLSEMILLAREAEIHLRAVYRPDGLNLGLNLGKSAGAGVAGHVHLHALPRWIGDANFMTAVGETRVLPEDLETTWQRLSNAFKK